MAYVKSGDFSVFYEVEGEGPALVFLHGGGGNASSWWQQVAHFSKSYKTIVVDNRGFGRTHPINPEVADINAFADDVCAVLDAEDIDKAHLICQSLGGWTGLRMALGKPERVKSLTVSNSPMGVLYPKAMEDAFTFVMSLAGSGMAIEDAALSKQFRESKPEAFWLYRHLNQLNPLTLRGAELGIEPNQFVQRMFAPDIQIPMEKLAEVTVPTLLVGGRHDPLVKPETMEEYARHIPGAQAKIFEGAGHSPYFEIPDAFNAFISSFLAASR